MREKPIFKDFDLPTIHLGPENHYVPEKAYDEGEIARRAQLPWGALIAEQQYTGLQVASNILQLIEQPASIEFSAQFLAASGLNTAWYCFARNAEVQRRRLKLPMLAAGPPDWRPSSEDLQRDAATGFTEAQTPATKVISAFEYRSPRVVDFNTDLGRTVGHASLTLAAVDVGDVVKGNVRAQDHHVQNLVRERAKTALKNSRTLVSTIGSHPSIAQLANPNSDLSHFWRHNAPNEARQAFDVAFETTQESRQAA